jgi:glutathione S-transferase
MITLHHCPQSRSMRTLWLLNELELDFQIVVHPFDKSRRKPEYLQLSPAGRVPALEIDGEQMFETGAITEYLCEKFSPDNLGRSWSSSDRMNWLIWVHFAETISQHAAALTQQHEVLYKDEMRSPILMKIEAARIAKCFDALEACLSSTFEKRDYLLKSGFSAADISVGQAVYMARHFTPLDGHRKMAKWYSRITERQAFKSSLPTDSERLYSQDFYPVWEV